jgi:hypothetical protein
MLFNIPFEFNVGGKAHGPGTYVVTLRQYDSGRHYIGMRAKEGPSELIWSIAVNGKEALTKELDHLSRWEWVGGGVEKAAHREVRSSVTQSLAHYTLVTPQHRSRHAGGGDELREGLEHLSHESFRSPVSQGDDASGVAHSQQFFRRRVPAAAQTLPQTGWPRGRSWHPQTEVLRRRLLQSER